MEIITNVVEIPQEEEKSYGITTQLLWCILSNKNDSFHMQKNLCAFY